MIHSQDAVLAVGAALSSLGMGLLIPVLPSYAASLGAGGAQIGLLLAGLGLARLLVALPAVGLTQRLGHRRLLITSAALTVPAAITCAAASGFWTLTLFCFVEGGTAGVFGTVGMSAVMAGRKSEHRGRSLATYQSAGLVGASLGPGIGGLVAQQLGVRVLFLFYAALAAVVAIWLHRALKPPVTVVVADTEPQRETPHQRLRQLLGSPALLPLWLLVFALMFTRTGTQLIAAPLLGARHLGLSPAAIGFALMLGGFGALSMLYPSGWLTDRYGWTWTLVAGGLGMTVALVLLSASNSYGVFLPLPCCLVLPTVWRGQDRRHFWRLPSLSVSARWPPVASAWSGTRARCLLRRCLAGSPTRTAMERRSSLPPSCRSSHSRCFCGMRVSASRNARLVRHDDRTRRYRRPYANAVSTLTCRPAAMNRGSRLLTRRTRKRDRNDAD